MHSFGSGAKTVIVLIIYCLIILPVLVSAWFVVPCPHSFTVQNLQVNSRKKTKKQHCCPEMFNKYSKLPRVKLRLN